MIVSIDELITCLGLSLFEVWLHCCGLLVFVILLLVRHLVPDIVTISVTRLSLPLFVVDVLSLYFCVIVLFRNYVDGWRRPVFLRVMWSLLVLALLLTFKYLLVRKLNGTIAVDYSGVMAPLFILLNMLMVRVCQL